MSNSKLVTYTNLTPNCNKPRNHKIDTITIHCYVGQVTAKQGCDYFVSVVGKRNVSANYVVGYDGSIGLSVEECNRAWTSSNAANDHRAITIEVACDTFYPYAITPAAYNALVELVADICKRNGIKELLWKNNKSLIGQVDKQNMTIHRWFAATACPGDDILGKMNSIVKEVNAKIKPAPAPAPAPAGTLYRVQVGAFSKISNANKYLAKLKAAGFDGFVTKSGGFYKVQVGAFSKKENAENYMAQVKAAGFDAFIVEVNKGQNQPAPAPKIAVGSSVKVKQGAKTYSGGSLASFVYSTIYKVSELDGNRAVIEYNGTTVAAMNVNDLILVG